MKIQNNQSIEETKEFKEFQLFFAINSTYGLQTLKNKNDNIKEGRNLKSLYKKLSELRSK